MNLHQRYLLRTLEVELLIFPDQSLNGRAENRGQKSNARPANQGWPGVTGSGISGGNSGGGAVRQGLAFGFQGFGNKKCHLKALAGV